MAHNLLLYLNQNAGFSFDKVVSLRTPNNKSVLLTNEWRLQMARMLIVTTILAMGLACMQRNRNTDSNRTAARWPV